MNLLIVDDEPLIHVSIECCLKEIKADDVQVFHASSGTEMLERMSQADMDAALVDIRMPGASGLEAIESARALWPQTFYYIMSGFSEFEYAREAIKLNVVEYLLKPLEPEALAAVIARVRRERARQWEQLRDSFRAWLEGSLHQRDASSLYPLRYYAAVTLLTYDSGREDLALWTPDFLARCHEHILSLPCQEGVLLLVFSREPSVVQDVLRRFPRRGYPEGVTCFVSSVCGGGEELAVQLRQLLECSPVRVFRGIGARYDLVSLLPAPKKEITAGRRWIALRDQFLSGQYADYVALGTRLSHSVREPWMLKNRDHLAEFLGVVTGAPFAGPMTEEALADYLRRFGETLIAQHKNPDKLDAILAYVEENSGQDISIASLAAQFDLSPNYLSALLKKRLGIKFMDYLTGLRIAHAKNLLLSTGKSIREITEEVGYYSQSHFNKLFLEREGCTPGEYRLRGQRKTG